MATCTTPLLCTRFHTRGWHFNPCLSEKGCWTHTWVGPIHQRLRWWLWVDRAHAALLTHETTVVTEHRFQSLLPPLRSFSGSMSPWTQHLSHPGRSLKQTAGSADAALTRGSDSRVLSGVEDSSMFTHHAQNAAPHPGPRGGAAGKLGIGEGFSPRIILVDVITSLQKLIF